MPVEDNDFTIDESINVKVISYYNTTTYTMLIKKEIDNPQYFENLVIQIQTDSQPKAYISKYTPSEEPRYVAVHNEYTFKGSFEIHEILYNSSVFQSIYNISGCGPIAMCDYGPETHNAGPNCDNTYIVMGTCDSANGGGAGGAAPSTPVTTPTGGGGTPPTTIQTAIPCAKLKSKTSGNSSYMNNFRTLNTQANFDLNHEKGFFEKKVNGATQYAYGTEGPTTVNYPSSATGYTHVHNNSPRIDANSGDSFDGNVKMLSPADLWILLFNCQKAAIASGQTQLDVYGVMISEEAIFSLTIIDSNINATDVKNKWNEFVSEYNKKSKAIITETGLTSYQRSDQLQKMMLEQLEYLGLKDKVALFQGTVDELGKLAWTRKALDANKKMIANGC